MSRRSGAALAALLPLLLLARLVAADASLGETLVTGFVTDVTTLSAGFEQSVLDAEGALIDTSSGTIEIQRPGRFRWATDEPYQQQVIADGLNVWSYDVDLAQVTVKPQADALANTPALLLGGDADAQERARHVRRVETERLVEVALSADEVVGLEGDRGVGDERRNVARVFEGELAEGTRELELRGRRKAPSAVQRRLVVLEAAARAFEFTQQDLELLVGRRHGRRLGSQTRERRHQRQRQEENAKAGLLHGVQRVLRARR